jgi:N-acetylneuraminate lyase
MLKRPFEGLIAAVHTPMKPDGELNTDLVPDVVEQLLAEGVDGFFVCGSTGEGISLSTDERISIVNAYVNAADGRVPVIAHVGHNSLREACRLATAAAEARADAIAAVPPSYFPIDSVQCLIECYEEISRVAPSLPFYHYHIPERTGSNISALDIFHAAADRLPAFAGMKYTYEDLAMFRSCLNFSGDRFDCLFGRDEMLLAALAMGAKGAVGTTYTFAAPLYKRIMTAFDEGRMEDARLEQDRAIQMIRIMLDHGGLPLSKALMRAIGLDHGPVRLPLNPVPPNVLDDAKAKLQKIGFYEWARH